MRTWRIRQEHVCDGRIIYRSTHDVMRKQVAPKSGLLRWLVTSMKRDEIFHIQETDDHSCGLRVVDYCVCIASFLLLDYQWRCHD